MKIVKFEDFKIGYMYKVYAASYSRKDPDNIINQVHLYLGDGMFMHISVLSGADHVVFGKFNLLNNSVKTTFKANVFEEISRNQGAYWRYVEKMFKLIFDNKVLSYV